MKERSNIARYIRKYRMNKAVGKRDLNLWPSRNQRTQLKESEILNAFLVDKDPTVASLVDKCGF